MMNMKILVTGRLPQDIFAGLKERFDVEMNTEDKPFERKKLLDGIRNKDGLLSMITDSIDEEFFERAMHLKMIAQFGVGYNNIDVAAATRRGIPVSNTPGVLTDATAEIAFVLILAVARRIVEGDRMTREGRFRWWAPMLFLGHQVTGKTLGIIGMGKIGTAVAERARCFGMPVLYHNRERISPSLENEVRASYVDMKTLLSRSDFVSLHVPLTERTRHLIGREELSLMKRTAYLINTSRGPVVDEQALLHALRAGDIAGAGLDVYENEPALTPGLTELDNVILLPHVGSGTVETRMRMAGMAAENLITGLSGEVPPNLVNPDVLATRRR